MGGRAGTGLDARMATVDSRAALRYPQRLTPRRITARRGERSASTQTRRGTHRGERAKTLPDQNVTGRPSALLPERSPGRHAVNVTTRCVWRRYVSPWGRGPYARPAARLVLGDSSTVTRCPFLTSSGNFWKTSVPVEFDTALGVPPAPMSARGPTTRLRGFVKAPGKLASDLVAQLSTAPRGRSLPCSTASPQAEPVRSGTTAVATVALTTNMPRRAVIQEPYTGGCRIGSAMSLAATAGLCRPALH
jgi:hypothetical protein